MGCAQLQLIFIDPGWALGWKERLVGVTLFPFPIRAASGGFGKQKVRVGASVKFWLL